MTTEYIRGQFPTCVDNSMRKSLVRCQKLAYWKHERGLQLADGANIHLVAGRAFAAGLHRARVAFHDEHADAFESLREGLKSLAATYNYTGPMPAYCYKTLERMEAALAFYLEKWPLASDMFQPIRLNNGKLALELAHVIELSVRHPITEQPLCHVMNFDMLALDPMDRLWVIDEKTTSKMGDAWSMQWTLDSQLSAYCYAARDIAVQQGWNHEVAGALIRGIAIHKSDFAGMECLEPRQQWEIDRWYEQMNRDMYSWTQASRYGTHAQILDHACALYNAPCEYAKLCKAHDPERLIENNYIVKHYDPLNRD